MKSNETGRSMIEMFAVLAIIGIITVGGLAGYQTAMRKFRANAITELVAEFSVAAQTRNRCVSYTELESADKPECLSDIKGFPQGQVQLTFNNTDSCKEMIPLVGANFPKCKWEKETDNKWRYIPDRSCGEGLILESC